METLNNFIQQFYANTMLNGNYFFPDLPRDEATLIIKRLIDFLVNIYQQQSCSLKITENKNCDSLLSKIEMHGLHYIGGYVCQKSSKKLKNSKSWKSEHVQMPISFIKATRTSENQRTTWRQTSTWEDFGWLLKMLKEYSPCCRDKYYENFKWKYKTSKG